MPMWTRWVAAAGDARASVTTAGSVRRRRRPSIADNAAGGTRRPSRVKRDRSLKPYRHATLIVGRRRRRSTGAHAVES